MVTNHQLRFHDHGRPTNYITPWILFLLVYCVSNLTHTVFVLTENKCKVIGAEQCRSIPLPRVACDIQGIWKHVQQMLRWFSSVCKSEFPDVKLLGFWVSHSLTVLPDQVVGQAQLPKSPASAKQMKVKPTGLSREAGLSTAEQARLWTLISVRCWLKLFPLPSNRGLFLFLSEFLQVSLTKSLDSFMPPPSCSM